MKRFAIVIIVAFVLAIGLSSCNNEVCPAYTDAGADTEHIV